MPLAPLGCHAMACNKQETRTSWRHRASEGFYVGTSTEHFQCFKIWMKETHTICITDIVQFQHKHITMPNTMPEDTVTTTKQLAQALANTPMVQTSETTQQALQRLSNICNTSIKSSQQTKRNDTETRVNLPPQKQTNRANSKGAA